MYLCDTTTVFHCNVPHASLTIRVQENDASKLFQVYFSVLQSELLYLFNHFIYLIYNTCLDFGWKGSAVDLLISKGFPFVGINPAHKPHTKLLHDFSFMGIHNRIFHCCNILSVLKWLREFYTNKWQSQCVDFFKDFLFSFSWAYFKDILPGHRQST